MNSLAFWKSHISERYVWPSYFDKPVFGLIFFSVFRPQHFLNFRQLLLIWSLPKNAMRLNFYFFYKFIFLILIYWLNHILLPFAWTLVSVMAVFITMEAHYSVVCTRHLIFLYDFFKLYLSNFVFLTKCWFVPNLTAIKANWYFLIVVCNYCWIFEAPIFLIWKISQHFQWTLSFWNDKL